jgi:hypothetical protein
LNREQITGLGQVTDIAVSGGFLYVSGLLPNFRGAVSKYATSGRLVNRFLITGEPGGIAVSGDHLFITFPSFDHSRVGEYTTSGQWLSLAVLVLVLHANAFWSVSFFRWRDLRQFHCLHPVRRRAPANLLRQADAV